MAAQLDAYAPGARVRVVGLVKAARHNGTLGTIQKEPAPEGRVAVALDGSGKTIAVKKENLEVVQPPPKDAPKTLARHHQLLAEFDGSRDPETLALYYHVRDKAFDAYDAAEYNAQMLRYYAAGITCVAVAPRRIRGNEYLLVCLRYEDLDRNSLCELGFQCMRSFCGVCILVKRRCFVCGRPGAPTYAAVCCFCPGCETRGLETFGDLCAKVEARPPEVEEEVLTIF